MKTRIIGKFIGRDHGTVYPCSNCGADTRDTGHGELGNELCAECQDAQEVEEQHENHARPSTTCPLCMKDPVKVKLTLAAFKVWPTFRRKFHLVQVTKEHVMVTGERKALEVLLNAAEQRDFDGEDDAPIWYFNTAAAVAKALNEVLNGKLKRRGIH